MKTVDFYGGMPMLMLRHDDKLNGNTSQLISWVDKNLLKHPGRSGIVRSIIGSADKQIEGILKSLEDGQSLLDTIVDTVVAIRNLQPRMCPFLRPETLEEVCRPEEELVSDGQERTLASYHGALITLLFKLLAEFLLSTNPRNSSQQDMDEHFEAEPLRTTIQIMVKGFDNNWPHLSRNMRVKQQPDLWSAMAQARATLHVAVARAQLVLDQEDVTKVWDLSQESKNGTESRLDTARQNLRDARDLGRWSHQSSPNCSRRGKYANELWQLGFCPLLEWIEGAVLAWSEFQGRPDWLCLPVVDGPCKMTIRKMYTFLNVDIEYSYDTDRQRRLMSRSKKFRGW